MAPTTGSTIIPTLQYRNAHVAIDWLCNAFGFERHAVYGDADVVHHAQLIYGSGMIMLSSSNADSDWSKRCALPHDIDNRVTQGICVLVDDADAHYERAKAAGATIEMEIADQDYGGRGYGCRDLEGHLWWFGTYNPWTA